MIVMLPLVEHVPHPKDKNWKKRNCPCCGRECWEGPLYQKAMKMSDNSIGLCTLCALEKGRKNT